MKRNLFLSCTFAACVRRKLSEKSIQAVTNLHTSSEETNVSSSISAGINLSNLFIDDKKFGSWAC